MNLAADTSRMTRTDIHRPSVIEPANYQFVAFEHLKSDGIGDAIYMQMQRRLIREHMARTGDTYSRHAHGGNCHICGAAAIYTALFYHADSRAYVRTGLECAEKLECDGVEQFRREIKTALEQATGKRKAKAVLEAAGLAHAWTIYLTDSANDKRDESTLREIIGKLVKYGSISEAQTRFLRSLADRIERRPAIEAQRAAETEAAAPVPVTDKRVTVSGKVLTVRKSDPDAGQFGDRMLIQHADGWKVWGSVPLALDGVKHGDNVVFDARIKVSDKDSKFGFFSRPTKASKDSA